MLKKYSNVIVTVFLIFSLVLLTYGKLYVIKSNSMSPFFVRGDIIYIQEYNKYAKNDVISFEINDLVITHRVVNKNVCGYITKGDANKAVDPNIVKNDQILGKVVFIIPKLGYLFIYSREVILSVLLCNSIIYLIKIKKQGEMNI